jgi:hypothetical protein
MRSTGSFVCEQGRSRNGLSLPADFACLLTGTPGRIKAISPGTSPASLCPRACLPYNLRLYRAWSTKRQDDQSHRPAPERRDIAFPVCHPDPGVAGNIATCSAMRSSLSNHRVRYVSVSGTCRTNYASSYPVTVCRFILLPSSPGLDR